MKDLDFETLVERFYESLYRFALSLSRNEDDAWDLVQQTFALWGTKGHQLRDPSKVKSWLFTTLYREFLAGQRRNVRFPHEEMEQAQAHLPSVPPRMAEELDGKDAARLLGELDEVFRAPLALFYLQQHSYQEIAEILEIPIGTVMSRISRGKKHLKEALLAKTRQPQQPPSRIVPFPGANLGESHG